MKETQGIFVSYAQNYEDVMLRRACKHVANGFYIDIGAWSPDVDSVTKTFYDHGWRGLNIEPNSVFHQQLDKMRMLDTNLLVAVGDYEGEQAINIVGDSGLSTLDDSIAEEYRREGWSVSRKVVQIKTLASIWEKYIPEGQEVNFLKIDVEGYEGNVLRGNDWLKYRPWIVLIEATKPMSQLELHDRWEDILLESNYIFAYADGLNRFYLAGEHSELLSAFEYPPNIFDGFVSFRQYEAEALAEESCRRVAEVEVVAADAEARAVDAEARAVDAEARVVQVDMFCKAVEGSLSWKITYPLRLAKTLFISIVGKIRSFFTAITIDLLIFIKGSKRLRGYGKIVARNFPRLRLRICNVTGVKPCEQDSYMGVEGVGQEKAYRILDSLSRSMKGKSQ